MSTRYSNTTRRARSPGGYMSPSRRPSYGSHTGGSCGWPKTEEGVRGGMTRLARSPTRRGGYGSPSRRAPSRSRSGSRGSQSRSRSRSAGHQGYRRTNNTGAYSPGRRLSNTGYGYNQGRRLSNTGRNYRRANGGNGMTNGGLRPAPVPTRGRNTMNGRYGGNGGGFGGRNGYGGGLTDAYGGNGGFGTLPAMTGGYRSEEADEGFNY